jgi:hypothetical protein
MRPRAIPSPRRTLPSALEGAYRARTTVVPIATTRRLFCFASRTKEVQDSGYCRIRRRVIEGGAVGREATGGMRECRETDVAFAPGGKCPPIERKSGRRRRRSGRPQSASMCPKARGARDRGRRQAVHVVRGPWPRARANRRARSGSVGDGASVRLSRWTPNLSGRLKCRSALGPYAVIPDRARYGRDAPQPTIP